MDEFKKLSSLYEEINKIYFCLCDLEIKGLIHSSYFKKMVILLKKKIQQENRLFESFYNSEGYDELKDSIVCEDGPIFMRVRDYMTLYEALNIGIDDESETDEEILKKLGKLYDACSNNIFLIYLSFLQECIDLSDDVEIKKRLISLKYYNSFTKHNIEKNLIDANFVVAKDNYVNLYFVAETLGLDIMVCDDTILDSYLSIIVEMIRQLLSINDKDRKTYNMSAACINMDCLLRACLSLMSETEYNRVESVILETIDECENNTNINGVELINSILNNRKNDKMRIRKISTRIIND